MYICSQNLLSVSLSEYSVIEGILMLRDPFPANLCRIVNILL